MNGTVEATHAVKPTMFHVACNEIKGLQDIRHFCLCVAKFNFAPIRGESNRVRVARVVIVVHNIPWCRNVFLCGDYWIMWMKPSLDLDRFCRLNVTQISAPISVSISMLAADIFIIGRIYLLPVHLPYVDIMECSNQIDGIFFDGFSS